ncbi:receptor, partial [candidate division WWE3 bacterium]|nr:receptor [candidate division WWE3 bacterium]
MKFNKAQRLYVFWVVLFLLLSRETVLAQNIPYDVQLNDSITEYDFVLSKLHALVDTTNQKTFDEILANNNKFKVYPKYTKNDYDINSTYWVRLNIKFNTKSKRKWVLEFYDQTIDSISMYRPNSYGGFTKIKMGDQINFEERNIKHKNFLFLIENPKDSVYQYYFKINSANKADVRIVIRSLDRFVHYALNEYFAFGIFYGLILIISVYNFLLFFAIKEKKYILYTFYLLSVGIYAMCT